MSSISVRQWRGGKMSATPDLTLWGVGTSRTIRPHWAMHELGLPYKTKPIGPRTGETKTAEYTKLNPPQKAPSPSKGPLAAGRRFLHRRKRGDRCLPFADVLDAGALTDSRSAARICRLAGMVFLCRGGTGFHQPLRDAPASGRRARSDLRRRARGGRQGRRVFSRAVASCRGRACRWPAVSDG